MNAAKGSNAPHVAQNTQAEFAIKSAYIAQARAEYGGTSEMEIDSEPDVSLSEGGAWVSAWVWISDEVTKQIERWDGSPELRS